MESFDCLPPGYTYYVSDQLRGEKQITFLIKEASDEASVRLWLDEFSNASKTTWRVQRTYPSRGKINVFQISMRCQHATDRRVTGTGPSKNTNCTAQLHIRVKSIKRKRKINEELEEYPCIITLRNNHNHELFTHAVLKYRDLAPEIKEKLWELSRYGYRASSALHAHKVDLVLEYGDHYNEVAEDGRYMPSLSIVAKLYEKELSSVEGTVKKNITLDDLEKFLEQYQQECNGKAEFRYTENREHYYVVLCTPLMLRVHESVSESGELVFIDTCKNSDKHLHRVYFITTVCAVGGLPLGVVITNTEDAAVLAEGLLALKNLVGYGAFCNKGYPKVFLVDDNSKISALEASFPLAKTLLCQFRVLKSVWLWLFNVQNDLPSEIAGELYFAFRKLLQSLNEKEVQKNLEYLVLLANDKGCALFIKYVMEMWEKKESWVSCFRDQNTVQGWSDSNYDELVFSMFKDHAMERVILHHPLPMVHFITTRFEMLMKQKLTDFCSGQSPSSMFKKMLSHRGDFNVRRNEIDHIFAVGLEGEKSLVDVVRRMCSCNMGKSGKLCKHVCAVILFLDHCVSTAFSASSENTKSLIMYVASGITPAVTSQTRRFLILNREENDVLKTEIVHEDCNVETSEPDMETEIPEEENVLGQSANDELSPNELQSLDDLFLRMKDGLKHNSPLFVPAVRKLLHFANSDTDIVHALNTCGSNEGQRQKCFETNKREKESGVSRRKVSRVRKKRVVCKTIRGHGATVAPVTKAVNELAAKRAITRRSLTAFERLVLASDQRALADTLSGKRVKLLWP